MFVILHKLVMSFHRNLKKDACSMTDTAFQEDNKLLFLVSLLNNFTEKIVHILFKINIL